MRRNNLKNDIHLKEIKKYTEKSINILKNNKNLDKLGEYMDICWNFKKLSNQVTNKTIINIIK